MGIRLLIPRMLLAALLALPAPCAVAARPVPQARRGIGGSHAPALPRSLVAPASADKPARARAAGALRWLAQAASRRQDPDAAEETVDEEEEEQAEEEPARPTASQKERELLDEVDSTIGPIVAEREAPVLYETMRRILEPLSAAQQRLFPAGVLSINRLFIVDSQEKNAFVSRIKEEGIRKSANLVFVTTGLLKAMMDKGSTRAGLQQMVIRMAGILSHELAHPLDYVDGEGITANWGEGAGLQAMEIRADAEGMVILREAGYPVEAVYLGLQKLFETTEADGSTAFTEFTQTHPQDDLRLATQRMLLTLQRYQKGRAEPTRPDGFVGPSLPREIHSIRKSSRRWRFQKPKTLLDALERLRKLMEPKGKEEKERHKKLSEEYRKIEFNRLLLAADELLRDKGEALSDEEYKRFQWLAERLGRRKGGEILTRSQMREMSPEDDGAREFLGRADHFELMPAIPAYRSPRYLDWVRARFVSGKRVDSMLPALVRVAPGDVLFPRFGDQIAAALRGSLNQAKGRIRQRYETIDLAAYGDEEHHVEFQLGLARLFHEKVLPRLAQSQRLRFLLGALTSGDSYVYPQFESEKGTFGITRDRMELLGNPKRRELAAWYRSLLRSIWEQRGLHGALDILRDDSQLDWEAVFAMLGIERSVGYGQVRQAVKAFTASPAYAALAAAVARLRKPGYVTSQEEELAWTDATLSPYLSGDRNPRIQKMPALHARTKALFNGNYLHQRPELFRSIYGRRLARALDAVSGELGLEGFAALHEGVLKRMLGTPNKKLVPLLLDLQASRIGASGLAEDNKRRLLESLFVKSYRRGSKVPGLLLQRKADSSWEQPHYKGFWLNEEEYGANKKILAALLEHRAVEDSVALFSNLLEDEEDDFKRYFQAVARFKDELLRDLEKRQGRLGSDRQRFSALRSFVVRVLDPGHGRYEDSSTANAKDVRDIKARVAAMAEGLDIPDAPMFELFYRLTGSGPVTAADAFFRRYFDRHYGGGVDAPSYKRIVRLLENRRLGSVNLQLLMARKALEPEIRRLEARAPHVNELNALIEKAKGFVPSDSTKKDEFLESLAWRLRLRDTALGALIEDEKSYNWRKTSPLLLRLGSAASRELMKLDRKARLELIEYLISPETREMPESVVKKITRGIYEDAIKAAPRILRKKNRAKAARKLREAGFSAADIKLRIEAALLDSTPQERIPFFELLIAGGKDAFVSQPDFPYSITRPFLKYAPGSVEERLLLAFLDIVPAHERSVSLAYLLSQVGQDKASVNDIFEVFQAVGIKFAQLNAVWKFLGEEIAAENRKLKDRARPLTLAEILAVMNSELKAAELARVKYIKRILGSASLNSVVLVELDDGQEVAMAVQRPHAAEQIADNLDLGAKFLEAARRRGVVSGSRLLDSLLGSFKTQLSDELSMPATAENLRAAAGFYEGLNETLAPVLQGWRFRVPRLWPGFEAHQRILFMEKAAGLPFDSDELPDSARAAVGPALVRSSLQTLFRHGWFDPDRHTGNFLIDPRDRAIWVLDFGQAERFSRQARWKADDRATLAQFLAAVDRRDARQTMRYGLAMAAPGPGGDTGELEAAVAAALSSERGVADTLLAVANAFAEQQIEFQKKFAFGALKGLMVLYGERYVDDGEFRRILEREIRRLLGREKLPLSLLERLDARGMRWQSTAARR